MKKYLALLLVMALSLTAILGIAPIASAEDVVTPSQDIAYFNVSIKVGARLLYAVPADGYTINDDGTVDGLELLVWEEDSDEANAVSLEAQGKQVIGDKTYVIFSYNELAASEMAKVVYAKVAYTAADSEPVYGDVYDYSVAEFAYNYFNKDGAQHIALVEALITYGYYAAIYAGIADYPYTVDYIKENGAALFGADA